MDKAARDEAMARLRDKYAEDLLEEEMFEAERIKNMNNALWAPYKQEAEYSSNLNISWKGHPLDFFNWDRVLEVPDVFAIRIVGQKLEDFPERICQILTRVRVISLNTNYISSLPPNINHLKYLTELDLLNNRLTTLPDSICKLVQLTRLNLTRNHLSHLPANFAALTNLTKLESTSNKIIQCPASFPALVMPTICLDYNCLTSLPSLQDGLTALVSLSLSNNLVTALPPSIGSLPSLTSLNLANNRIKRLPDEIGRMVSLESLRLDWNLIKQLPIPFMDLESLTKLSMEGCIMVRPSMGVVQQGPEAVRSWCRAQRDDYILYRRREICLSLMALLECAQEAGVSPSLLEASEERPEGEDGVRLPAHAIVFEKLITDIAPRVQEFWRTGASASASASAPRRRRHHHHEHHMELPVSSDEVLDAVLHFHDHFGPVARWQHRQFFRHCACEVVDGEGRRRRRVCVPTRKGFKCTRRALIVKAGLSTGHRLRDAQLWAEKEREVGRYVEAARVKAEAHVQEEQMVLEFTHKAEDMVHKLQDKAKACIDRRQERRQRRKQLVKDRVGRRKKRDALRKAREKREKKLEAKKTKLLKSIAVKKTAKAKKKEMREEIHELESQLDNMPEDEQLDEIGSDTSDSDLVHVSATSSSSGTSSSSSVHDISDEQPEPATAEEEGEGGGEGKKGGGGDDDGLGADMDWLGLGTDDEERMGALGGGNNVDDTEDEDEDDEEDEEERAARKAEAQRKREREERKRRRRARQQRRGSVSGVSTTDLLRRRAAREQRRQARLVLSKKPPKEQVVEWEVKLKARYVRKQMRRAERQVRQQYHLLKEMLHKMNNHFMLSHLRAWHVLVVKHKHDRAKDKAKAEQQAVLEREGAVAAHEMGKFMASKWDRFVDEFSDMSYFVQRETGESSWDPPEFWNEIHPEEDDDVERLEDV